MVPGSGESTGLRQEWRTGRKSNKHQAHTANIFNINLTAALSGLDWIKQSSDCLEHLLSDFISSCFYIIIPTLSYGIQITYLWSKITNFWSQIADYRLLITDDRWQITDFRSQIPDYRFLITDCRLQTINHRLQIIDFRSQIADYILLIADYRDHRWQITDILLLLSTALIVFTLLTVILLYQVTDLCLA